LLEAATCANMLIFATFFTCVAAATVLVRKEKMEPGKLAHVAMDDLGSLLSLTQDQLPKKDRDGLEDDDDDEYEMEKDEQEPEEEERFIEQEIGKQGKGEGKQGKGLVQGVKDQCETCGLVGAWADAHKAAQKALADAQKAAQKALADAHKAAQKAAQKAAKTAPKTSPKAAPKTAPKGTPKAEPKAAPKAGEKGGQSLTAKKAKSGQLQAMDSRRLADSPAAKLTRTRTKTRERTKTKTRERTRTRTKTRERTRGASTPLLMMRDRSIASVSKQAWRSAGMMIMSACMILCALPRTSAFVRNGKMVSLVIVLHDLQPRP